MRFKIKIERVLSSQALNVGRSLGIITQKSMRIEAIISVSISLIHITTLKVIVGWYLAV